MQMSEQIAMPTSTFETVALNAVYEPIDITNRTEIQVLSKQNELLELNKKQRCRNIIQHCLLRQITVIWEWDRFFLFLVKMKV